MNVIPAHLIPLAHGGYVDPRNIKARDVRLEDVAHALSNLCRFTGHTRTFYSVAEHSVRVAACLRDEGADPLTQLWGLLHDATEAYVSDLPRPIKNLPGIQEAYAAAEDRALVAVAVAFHLPLPIPPEVHRVDLVLLATEKRDLIDSASVWPSVANVAPLPGLIVPWTPEYARARYEAMFEWLSGELRLDGIAA